MYHSDYYSLDYNDIMYECHVPIHGECCLLQYTAEHDFMIMGDSKEEDCCYGIRIRLYHKTGAMQYELREQAVARGFSESLRETGTFLAMLCDGMVLPMSLYEIVDDWKCAFSEGVVA